MVETFSLCGPWTLEEALGQREIPAQVPAPCSMTCWKTA